MRLHGILAHEQAPGDLPVAQAFGDELQDLDLARGEAELLDARAIDAEWLADGHGNLLYDEPCLRELESEPDTQCGEESGHESAVDLERVVEDQEAVLHEL